MPNTKFETPERVVHALLGSKARRFAPAMAMAVAITASSGGCQGTSEDAPRTFVIPFTPMFGTEVVRCGATFGPAGTSGAEFEVKDFLAFVHSVELVRASGEVVPLALVEDQEWQGGGVALLDFNDATGDCSGDPETNTQIVGTAPDHADYVSIRFGVGLPAALNHLDAVTAKAPFNKPSTWWSWKDGYKFFQLSTATAAHESFFVHIGATACEGSLDQGFSCAGEHEIAIELEDFVPGQDGVRINLANLLAGVDMNAPVDFASGDFVAGCMSFDPDPECDPIFTKFGRHFMSDETGPAQRVFEVDVGAAPDETPDAVDPTPQPGSDEFERDPALDSANVSQRDLARSHAPDSILQIGDRTHRRGPGSQCMGCHQDKGPGRGLFKVAGTIWQPDRTTPYGGATVKLLPIAAPPCQADDARDHCQGQAPGYYREEDVVATLVTDPNGNYYSTELGPEADPPFWPVVEPDPADLDLAAKVMGHPAASGSCNMCHGSIKLELASGD
ncbi:MbnP family copper-binding protein [Enhygromyxa salina]|uniref:Copper-binding protein MbnP-like domain-containing protein n=1 Tax=Enhygromyxa salina TaxID=215803 RepID=A0A2S9Y688_9BACT|nr:MbnP family copper-binding protein [Enhygromyxa salina]PRQ00521.1 hypothetical protein ENSA7_60150 [Enhygromyxa salina]